jgi:hypothetical protein
MFQAERFFTDGDGSFEQRLGGLCVTALAQQEGKIAESLRRVGMLGADHFLPDSQGALEERPRPC